MIRVEVERSNGRFMLYPNELALTCADAEEAVFPDYYSFGEQLASAFDRIDLLVPFELRKSQGVWLYYDVDPHSITEFRLTLPLAENEELQGEVLFRAEPASELWWALR